MSDSNEQRAIEILRLLEGGVTMVKVETDNPRSTQSTFNKIFARMRASVRISKDPDGDAVWMTKKATGEPS